MSVSQSVGAAVAAKLDEGSVAAMGEWAQTEHEADKAEAINALIMRFAEGNLTVAKGTGLYELAKKAGNDLNILWNLYNRARLTYLRDQRPRLVKLAEEAKTRWSNFEVIFMTPKPDHKIGWLETVLLQSERQIKKFESKVTSEEPLLVAPWEGKQLDAAVASMRKIVNYLTCEDCGRSKNGDFPTCFSCSQIRKTERLWKKAVSTSAQVLSQLKESGKVEVQDLFNRLLDAKYREAWQRLESLKLPKSHEKADLLIKDIEALIVETTKLSEYPHWCKCEENCGRPVFARKGDRGDWYPRLSDHCFKNQKIKPASTKDTGSWYQPDDGPSSHVVVRKPASKKPTEKKKSSKVAKKPKVELTPADLKNAWEGGNYPAEFKTKREKKRAGGRKGFKGGDWEQ